MLLTDVSAGFEPLRAAETHGQLFKSFHCLLVGASGGLKTRVWLDYGGWREHNNTSGGAKFVAVDGYQNLGTKIYNDWWDNMDAWRHCGCRFWVNLKASWGRGLSYWFVAKINDSPLSTKLQQSCNGWTLQGMAEYTSSQTSWAWGHWEPGCRTTSNTFRYWEVGTAAEYLPISHDWSSNTNLKMK